jgi:hypothetical protein
MHWYNIKRNPSGGGGGGAKTPLQLTYEEGEDLENLDKECVGSKIESLSNCGIKRNAGHHHMSMIVGTLTSEDH